VLTVVILFEDGRGDFMRVNPVSLLILHFSLPQGQLGSQQHDKGKMKLDEPLRMVLPDLLNGLLR
jgi:hypothetical protein